MICDHQLGCSDDSGWLLSSSASAPIGGSASTAELLHSIISDDQLAGEEVNKSVASDFLQSKSIQLSVAKEREVKYKTSKESRVAVRRSKVDYFHDFTNFDEKEHLDGCPVKWLFRRQTTENWSCRGFQNNTEEGADGQNKKKAVRDKIPKEMRVKKMGLKKRNSRQKVEDTFDYIDIESKREADLKRFQLAAKLNFKMFDSEEEECSEVEERTFSNFLPPRPLTGQKPWLCVLLAPRADCCFIPTKKREIPQMERCRSPTMSVRSLTLPEISKARPKTTPTRSAAVRWSGKKSKVPHTVRLEDKKIKEATSVDEEEKGEEDVNLLLVEDKLFRLKRFLNLEEVKPIKEDFKEKKKKKKKRVNESEGSIEIISSRVQFSERPGKPMR